MPISTVLLNGISPHCSLDYYSLLINYKDTSITLANIDRYYGTIFSLLRICYMKITFTDNNSKRYHHKNFVISKHTHLFYELRYQAARENYANYEWELRTYRDQRIDSATLNYTLRANVSMARTCANKFSFPFRFETPELCVACNNRMA